ncbi:MAG: enoyl-CoA hydratase/isomerase family protein, partial [Usitatibacter sp.]
MSAHYKHLLRTVEAGVCTLTLNRPEVLNAINMQLTEELIDAFANARRDSQIKVMVVTGAGRSFCTGRDLREFQRLQSSAVEDWELRISGRFLYGPLEDFEKPVIAMVNGFALAGGCEFAAACDFRIASDRATFALTEMDLAVFPGAGATYLLPRVIGKSRTLKMILTGEKLDASEALRIGLVDQVVPHDQLETVVGEMARGIATRSLPAIMLGKMAINQAEGHDLKAGIAINAALRALVSTTEDHRQALATFFERKAAR